MPSEPLPPPPSCPIAWQPHALAPVFFGRREVDPADGAPGRAAIFFPSLDGAVETAPVLEGCARYPLVVFVHGHCPLDTDHFLRWFHLPAQLARSGYVVVVPQLAGIESGHHPSASGHPDLATLTAIVNWMRSGWVHAAVLDDGPIGVVGHSFGALLGGRFAVGAEVGAFAGLSGVWDDWSGSVPHPLAQLRTATLLVWGGAFDFFTQVSDAVWNALPPPKHRAAWAEGEHWDYLVGPRPPCSPGDGSCGGLGAATTDLVTLFLGKYLPPELATHLPDAIPNDLVPPALDLTSDQQFFAGGHLSGFAAIDGQAACAVEQQADPWPLLANRRTRETHSRTRPCAWVGQIAPPNRRFVNRRPEGYNWCDFCFPHLADG